jgi:hypothetical protein
MPTKWSEIFRAACLPQIVVRVLEIIIFLHNVLYKQKMELTGLDGE